MKNNNLSEEWRDVPNYDGIYQVSNLGRVKSLNYNHTKQEKILKPLTNSKGYLQVQLWKERKMKSFKIHRLVLSAFNTNYNTTFEVNHINEIKSDNRLENLELCDRKYNVTYGTRLQKVSKKVYQYDLNMNLINIWNSTREADRNGFNHGNVASCCRGEIKYYKGFIWSYVPL